jgi:DNA-binding beta-propeller fold protein YncE
MSRQSPVANLKYSALLLCLGMLAASAAITPTPLPLPGGEGGIGFDDMGFAASLRKVLVPAGRSGNLDLIDPETKQVTAIGGFSRRSAFGGGHGQGVTSADEGRGLLFATDRDAKKLQVIDPKARSVVATAPLASGPDYVRFVSTTNEVWVTEPGAARIEIFSLPPEGEPKPTHADFIAISGGPESLIIDNTRSRAYTHLWTDTTIAIDLKSRKVAARWKNGCKGSRGVAMDDARGFLFVGCDEGKLSVLDLATGAQLGQASSGDGVDIIAYNSQLAHAYLPGEESASMAIIGISTKGAATVLGTVKTAEGSHCAATDDRGNAYICDPSAGRLLLFKDSFPGSK